MNPNQILIWMIGGLACLTILRGYTRGGRPRIAGSSLFIILAMTVAVPLVPNHAGYIGLALWALLIFLPSLTLHRLSRLVLRQDYVRALRIAKLFRALTWSRAWESQVEFLRAMRLAQEGSFDDADAVFEKLKKFSPALAETAELQQHRLHSRWNLVAASVQPDTRVAELDFNRAILYLRSLGEIGQPEALVAAYTRLAPRLQHPALPEMLRYTSTLFLLSFCGRVDAVRVILTEFLGHYPEDLKQFWLATAKMAGGEPEAARAELRELIARSDPLNESAMRWRLDHELPVAEVQLSQESRTVLDRIEKRMAEEIHFAVRSRTATSAAWLTRGIIAVQILVFGVEIALGGSTNETILERLGALVPSRVQDGEWWRLLAAAFLHWGPLHLAANMLGLYVLGPFTEYVYGSFRFAALFLICAMGSMGVCYVDFTMRGVDDALLVGASGAVMGLVGATAAALLRGSLHGSRLARRRLIAIGMIIALQTTFDFMVPYISWQAHLSGLVIGALLGAALLTTGQARTASAAVAKDEPKA